MVYTDIIIAVYGIGDQSRNSTVRSVASCFGVQAYRRSPARRSMAWSPFAGLICLKTTGARRSRYGNHRQVVPRQTGDLQSPPGVQRRHRRSRIAEDNVHFTNIEHANDESPR